MQSELAPCLGCDTTVSWEARACPSCGYDVTTHDRHRLLLGAIGTALALSVVLSPVGLALVHRARYHRLAADGTVTHRAAHGELAPSEILRAFLSLDASERGGEVQAA